MINKIFILKKTVDISDLKLQETEVAEVVWVEADEIMSHLKENDPQFCLNIEEYSKVLTLLRDTKK